MTEHSSYLASPTAAGDRARVVVVVVVVECASESHENTHKKTTRHPRFFAGKGASTRENISR